MRIEAYFEQVRDTVAACPAAQAFDIAYEERSMDAAQHLIFRYDNTGHHRKLDLSTYPDHKHDGGEETVVPSPGPRLPDVLTEIEALIEPPSSA
ncbi:MAG: DUF6516 family protein [Chloroflexota bacterium]|nr:DUF6516 family protein [Chloroflexota bacterium]